MDDASRRVVDFLESLQDAMQRMGDVWNHYVRRGTQPSRPFLVLSGRPFRVHADGTVREFHGSVTLGLEVKGTDAKEYELTVDVLWDTKCWTITAEAWVANDEGGQDILRQLPERTAVELDDCLSQVGAVVAELAGFEDLVLGGNG